MKEKLSNIIGNVPIGDFDFKCGDNVWIRKDDIEELIKGDENGA